MFGVYVESFSVSVGYGAESSTMQMVLIEDPDNFIQKLNANGVPLYKGTDSITGREIETTDTLSCDLNGENCTENEKIMVPDPIVLQHEVQVFDDDGLPEKNTDGSDKFETVAGFPPVGTVCQFALQGMEFVGVFQRYNYTQGLDGRRYDVTFESPAKILDGVQVILKGFEGTAFQLNPRTYFYPSEGANFTSQINNVYNPFGIKENFAWGGMFGYSDVNDQGFPVNDTVDDPTNIRDKGLLTLIEEISRSVYTYDNPNGADPDSSTNQDDEELIGGPINFGLNKLTIDFGKLKELIPDGYRISGEVTSINAILQDLTEICLHDYVSMIDPVLVTVPSTQTQTGVFSITGRGTNIIEKVFKNGVTPTVFDDDGNVVGPVISFKYQDKSEQPKPGVVAELVEDSKKGNTLISANNGKEYADVTTQKLMIGGDATRVWEVGVADLLPALGKDDNGNYLIGSGTGLNDLCPIKLPNGSTYVATNLELRLASSGRDMWGMYQQLQTAVGNKGLPTPRMGFSIMNNNGTGIRMSFQNKTYNAASLAAAFNSQSQQQIIDASILGNSAESVDAHFVSILDVARNYHGSTYLVPIPVEPGGIDNNLRYKNEFDIEAAWEIAEAAFDPEYRVEDITGYDDDGRLKACAGFTTATMLLTSNGWQNKGYLRDFSAIETQVPYRIPNNIAQAIGHSNYLVGTTDVEVEKEIIYVSNPYGDPNNPYDDIMAFVHVTVPQVLIWDQFSAQKSQALWSFWEMVELYGVSAVERKAGQLLKSNPWPADRFLDRASMNSIKAGMSPVVESGGGGQVGYRNGPNTTPLHPFRITIPQKSNRYSWGPWYKYNQKDGKAEVERNEELRPEVFGGDMALLDKSAFALADVSLANLYATETGTIELAEFPRHNYAERFNENGPYVTSMDVGVGVGGITTTYQFSTWTRSFGKIAKYNIDRIARINKNKIKRLKGASSGPHFPTKQNIASNVPQQQAGDFNNVANLFYSGSVVPSTTTAAQRANPLSQTTWSMSSDDGASLQHVLGDRVTVYGQTVAPYDVMFGCTMEQLFSPVGIRKNPVEDPDDELFPYIVKHKTPKNIAGDEDTQGKASLWEGDVRPVAKSLDPYFLPDTTDFSATFMNNYAWFSNDNSMLFEDYNYSPKQVASDIRTYGLRGPLLLSGWGYDLAGMPVPAREDKMDGEFYPANPALNRGWWKTGPVDLMWDDERQVWAGGLSFVEGKLTKSIEPAGAVDDPDTSGEALIYRRKYNRGDEKYEWKELQEKVTITNRDPTLKVDIEQAAKEVYVMLVRINYEWRVVYVGCDDFAG
jgi:hypothetical protein